MIRFYQANKILKLDIMFLKYFIIVEDNSPNKNANENFSNMTSEKNCMVSSFFWYNKTSYLALKITQSILLF